MAEMLNTVNVPDAFQPQFQKAQEYVSKYFGLKTEDPTNGTIEIFGERYILVRAASMSVDFFDTMRRLYGDKSPDEANAVTRSILFDIAHAIGKMDARNFHQKMGVSDPIERLSAGPIHFSHTGWAFVDISEDSRPSPDENYCLIYDHPFSFESDAWLRTGRKSDFPVCVMNAGYSSGWCEESFGISLVASEVMCKAKGDDACRFVMAPPSKIEQRIEEYMQRDTDTSSPVEMLQIPGLLQRKWMEDKLAQSEDNYQTIFNQVNDAIFLHEPNSSRIAGANNRACEMLGYTREELLRMEVGQISSGATSDNTEEARRLVRKAATEGPQVFEWHFKHKTGGLFWGEVNLKQARIMGRDLVLSVVRDITERKTAETALLEAKAQAEHANEQLQHAIVNMELLAERAGSANEAKSRFLASMSHEIRTPMNAIIGFADILAGDNLTKDQKDKVNIIRSSAQGMLELINDILDFSKIESGRIDIEQTNCSAREIVTTVENMMSPTANKKGISLEVSYDENLPERIVTDSVRLRQCIMNLVSNAVKFTQQGIVRIQAVTETIDGRQHITFHVIDTGIGMTPEEMGRIFEPFSQAANDTTRRFGGTGLGLSITKRLVGMMEGELTVKSEPGEGSTFSLSIPLVTGESETPAQNRSSLTGDKPGEQDKQFDGRILVAEDVYTNQLLIKAILGKMGFEVVIAEDGQEAVEKALSETFDIILMDMHMPRLNGIDATKQIREAGSATPIMALTASLASSDRQKCIAAGCNEYLSKPIDRAELTETLHRYLKSPAGSNC